jgi:LmbE family N-acetylglucosaminyl deacetylase
MDMNILAIGAHPDDIELGCGGLLIKAVRGGHSVYLYNLTQGEKAGNPEERTEELRKSAKYIGAKALFIDRFCDTKLSLSSDLINHIESCVNVCKPDLVITHPMTDTHHDHRAVAEATIEAGRNVSNILSYEMPLTKGFEPHLYFDISDTMDAKLELLSLFQSQSHKFFLESKAIRGLAQYRALQSRLGSEIVYSESFQIIKVSLDGNFALWNKPIDVLAKENIGTHSSDEIGQCIYV